MMDAVDTEYLVAAVLWLAQTILETLFTGKLEVWIRQIGLADDVEKLRFEIERVEMVVSAVNGRAIGNKPLARSLARLTELLYDADDAVDELDYYRLQQQLEGALACPESADGHGAEQVERPRGNADIPSSNGGKKRSKAWGHFDITEEENGKPVKAKCIHCHTVVRCGSDKGTSVLHNHIKSDSCKKKRGATDQQPNTCSIADGIANGTPAGDSSSRKRRRMNEESTHNTAANAHHWNEAEFSNRIKEITRQLQDIRGAVSEVLKLHGSDSVASTNQYRRTRSDVCPRTSSLFQGKIYGRDAEKNSIVKMIATDGYDRITILPIVGIGGVGKTALAQHVYDDLTVQNNFERIWVWVSDNIDEVRLTREMLDFVPQDRHDGSPQKQERREGISSFAKLQEILKGHMESQSKKFLLILDDVWDNMDDHRWNKLLAPFKSSRAKGNVILVTTRILSVAKRICTVEPIKLGALADEDFWLLFKACAFGDENYDGHVGLSTIGRQIADRLQGNPLAAETAGALLREHLTIDHWSNILKNEDWKSLQLSRGIMPALKFSYDQLPYHLQQCFSYCSIFPNKYQFLSEELIGIWIAQGYVNGGHSSKRLEEMGQDYLFDLVNSGFFQQNQTCYVMCGLMHDFAMLVSRTECATIDGLQCNEMLPTVRHLSIVTDSAYTECRHGNIFRNEEFEKILPNVVTSVRKLRTLVLIGQCNPSFLQWFQKLFKEAQNLRVLQISTKCAGFNSFLCNVANPSHLRYLKLEAGEEDGVLLQVLNKFYHLQVLDVGSDTKFTISNDVNNLVSLRHLVAEEDVYPSIANIGKMTSLQELHNFSVQNSSGFEITQLQFMNELVQLGVSQLENVKTREEAYEAGLRNKQQFGKLHLSWKDSLSQDEYDSDTAREVLEGLEPHHNLKHLRISEYNGATSPVWLANSLTSLQTLRLECCGKLQIIPSLERLPFLTKFELRNMLNITELSIPSLEELVLIKMPKLERCSCTSSRDLNSSLRVLKVTGCPVLKVFPLFEDCQKFKIEQKSWLSSLGELIIHKCPQLLVPHPLPPSTSVSKLSIYRVSTLPSMEGLSSGTLTIGTTENYRADEHSDELRTLDGKMLSFHNLRFLTHFRIAGCQNLTSISFEGLRQLISLKSLEIYSCEKLVSSHVLPEDLHDDLAAAICYILPSLERLLIGDCPEFLPSLVHEDRNDDQANGRWLLPQSLVELDINYSSETLQPCFPGNLTCLKRLEVSWSPSLESLQLHSCTALEKLTVSDCKSLASLEGLQSLGNLKALNVSRSPSLESLQLHSCTALEELEINFCTSLASLEGLQSLGNLKALKVYKSPSLESLQLQIVEIYNCGKLLSPHVLPEDTHEDMAAANCNILPSLERLRIVSCGIVGKWLSLMLRHVQALQELSLEDCEEITAWLSVEEEENSLSNLISSPDYPSSTSSVPDRLLCIPLNVISSLKKISIVRCRDLTSCGSKDVFARFTSLKELTIMDCPKLLPSLVHKGGNDDQANGRWLLPQSLVELEFDYSPETLKPCFKGNLTCLKRLKLPQSPCLESLQLHSCTALEDLEIISCKLLAALEGLQSLGGLRCLVVSEGPSLKSLQLQSCTALEKLEISSCESLAPLEGLQYLSSLRSLAFAMNPELCAAWDRKSQEQEEGSDHTRLLPPSLERLEIKDLYEEIMPCLLAHLPSLSRLVVSESPNLKSLQLHSCTTLEELAIRDCGSLAALEGLQSLGGLRRLVVYECPGLSLSRQGYELCPRLERLEMDDPSALTTSFCKHLTSLLSLGLRFPTSSRDEISRLTDEQEEALQLLTSLQELQFWDFEDLIDLPAGLHSLRSLKRLEIFDCPLISRLPEKGLPPSLEELEIRWGSVELKKQCKMLATSKLKVKIYP